MQSDIDYSQNPDPRQKNTSASDDVNIVWFFLCCPFSEWKSSLPMLHKKSLKEAEERFIEIIQSPELTQRVNEECKGDIISYKIAHWSKQETFDLVRLTHINHRINGAELLESFPDLFHPCRTPNSISATSIRLRSRDHLSVTQQYSKYREYIASVHAEAESLPPATLPPSNTIENIKQAIEEDALRHSNHLIPKNFSYSQLLERLSDTFTKALAALIGPGNIRPIMKTRVIIGRESPKCRPDIDLSDLNLQSISRFHLTISLRKDMKFYAECMGKQVMINGIEFRKGDTIQLNDRDTIDIGGALYIFFENPKIMSVIRSE